MELIKVTKVLWRCFHFLHIILIASGMMDALIFAGHESKRGVNWSGACRWAST